MSKFTDYIDGLADKTSVLAKDELKELIISAKKDNSEFVRMQAENVERWTIMLAAGELTPAGYKKLVSKMRCMRLVQRLKKASFLAAASRWFALRKLLML